MNIFSETACSELSHHGIRTSPILHVSEISRRQPKKAVTATFYMNSELQSDEELFVLFGDFDEVNNEMDIPSHEIGKNYISVQLNHFSE